MEKTQAILLRRYRFTETSLIVHWCSPELGLIKTVAKGALRPRSSFAGRLDLFFGAEIEFVRSRSSDLHILKELEVRAPRFGLRDSYLQTLAASYFVGLLELVAERETPIPDLHDLLERALNHLADARPRRRSITYYEEQLVGLLGISRPSASAAETLRSLHHRLPPQREELMDLTPER